MSSIQAFQIAFPLLPSRGRAQVSFRRPPKVSARRPQLSPRHVPRAQLAGNIEDMPAELIPPTRASLPSHWRRPGVYGVYSSTGVLQYVAAVSNVAEAIANHLRYVTEPNARHSVRMITVDSIHDAPLGKIAESWVMTHASAAVVPPGNGDEAPEWRLETPPGDVYLQPGEGNIFVEEEIQRVIRENDVVVFMKGVREAPRCGFSSSVVEAVRSVIDERFVCVDCLDGRNGNVREVIKQFSGWPTLPQLYVEGEFIGGADIVRDMMIQGQLQGMLEKAVAKQG